MDAKVVLVCGILLLFVLDIVQAEFLYNRILPKENELESLGLTCIPGRTIIKMKEHVDVPVEHYGGDSDDDDDARRSHMRFSTDDESCQMCVCSVEGKDEYCSNRPAMNVNECIRMAELISQFHKHEPYDHERALAYRIRRDLIWHDDEIPYDQHARCKRSRSYYSNSINANDTDIDVASDITSLIDYANTSICFYCVCSVAGDNAGCLPRNPWFCQYYRNIREPDASRDRYRILFQQDRPAYFRHLSWRMRRTMDDGMFDLIDNVGSGQKCTPFVSAYTDCTEDNKCTGCHKCSCSGDGTWECQTITQPCGEDDLDEDYKPIDDQMLDEALDEMLSELNGNKIQKEPEDRGHRAPGPKPLMDSPLIDVRPKQVNFPKWDKASMEDENIQDLLKMLRRKRSLEVNEEIQKDTNKSVIFHHTVDEINEDTLRNYNTSGTLLAAKSDLLPAASRRSSPLSNSSAPLQIEYTPPIHSSHAADNKVDTADIHDDQVDLLVHHKIYEIVGNKSQAMRDKDLSKVVVNELKGGQTEIIGDKDSPVISNITFTPENDTLTAMAFIAGNLLNKLWNMEKDGENSLETEHMKHEKIKDLLELFKEPLNLRQETFLKNALQQLSTAIESRTVGNVSVCENIEELKHKSGIVEEPKNLKPILKSNGYSDPDIISSETNKPKIDKAISAAAALEKITSILDLIQKYEKTQNMINDIKSKSKPTGNKSLGNDLSDDEQTTLNIFGNIIESLTKLIIPNKKSKKIRKGIKNKNFLSSDQDVKDKFKKLNLSDIALTTKDKIVLDYIKHMQNNPNCLFNKEEKKPLLPNIEGDILLNLAEFYKIKSMSDLLKIMNDDSNKKDNVIRTIITSTESSTVGQHITEAIKVTTITKPTIVVEPNTGRFESTKEKLKSHLKIILEDLVELQNMSNKDGKNIEIADALPCIYNLLKSKESNNNIQIRTQEKNEVDKNPVFKITQIVNNLKNEINNTIQTRRNYAGSGIRPKSAIVWERTVKSLGRKLKPTRRSLESDGPKSIEDVKTKIEKMENAGSNTYKSIAYLAEIPAAERLLLLKTLAIDTKKYISILDNIKEFVESKKEIPLEDYKIFSEFIDNANININLNQKVISKIDKPRNDMYLSNQEKRPTKTLSVFDSETDKVTAKSGINTVKLTRDQIINQLIKNRMLFYLKIKEGTVDSKSTINTKLAKKILFYLEMGNDNLARDLFRIFVTQNKKTLTRTSTPSYKISDAFKLESKPQETERRRAHHIPVPLIQFEDSKPSDREPWLNQEQLLKQLMNIKNMKI